MNTAVRCGRDNVLPRQNGMKYNENEEFMMKSVTLSLLQSAANAFDFGGPARILPHFNYKMELLFVLFLIIAFTCYGSFHYEGFNYIAGFQMYFYLGCLIKKWLDNLDTCLTIQFPMQMIWRPEQASRCLHHFLLMRQSMMEPRQREEKRRKLNHLNQTIARVRRGQFNGNNSY